MDHKEALRALVGVVNGGGRVSVRETNFGYVIRSEEVSVTGALRARIAPFVLAMCTLAALAVWILPIVSSGFAANAFLSLVLLAIGCVGFIVIRTVTSGFELHVDTHRRELRAAVLTAKGESWIRSSARFSDISDVYLRNSRSELNLRALCLRVSGERDVMPVAVGTEKTLLALHRRLMKDLRPMDERYTEFHRDSAMIAAGAARVRKSPYEVFPQIGPDELPS